MRSRAPVIALTFALLVVSLAVPPSPGRAGSASQLPLAHARRLAASCDNSAPGIEVTLEMQTAGTGLATADALAADVTIVNRRLAGFGATATVQPIPNRAQIRILLSSYSDSEVLVRVLVWTALFEIIDPSGQYLPLGTEVTTSLGGPLTPDSAAATQGPVYKSIVSSRDLDSAYPTENSLGQFVVGFTLKPAGGETLFAFTSANLGKPMSVVLDKVVISSPTINGAISDAGIIEGMPINGIRGLVVAMNSGPLAAPLRVVQSQRVSDSCLTPSNDPQTLFNLLANTPIDRDELPTGFGAATVSTAPTDVIQNFANAGIANLVGVVGAQIDDNTVFFYLVFEDPDSARAGMAAYGASLLHQGMQVASANGAIDQPWGCYAADASGQSVGLCMVQFANVLVASLSAVPSNPGQAIANATDLTTAGVNHLKRLLNAAA